VNDLLVRGIPISVFRLRLSMLVRLVAICALCLADVPAQGEEISKEEMRSLDEQVQEIKSDVLSIAAELSQLEEKLLYPSGTQVAVFVSIAKGNEIQLDSVEIRIDDAPDAHHIYTFKEVEALRKGGVQRIYTGNVPTGEHRLEVSVGGQASGGRDFEKSESLTFEKKVGPALLGVALEGTDFGEASIQLGVW